MRYPEIISRIDIDRLIISDWIQSESTKTVK